MKTVLPCCAVVAAVLLSPGCGEDRYASERAAAHRAILASNMHQMAIALRGYTVETRKLPDSIDQLKAWFEDDEAFAQLLVHPATGQSPAFVYVKPADKWIEVKNPSETGVFFELKDGKIDPEGQVAFADGHVGRADAGKVEPSEKKK